MPNPLNELPFLENFPQPVSLDSFQKELTRIFGKEEITGRPWVRIIWMPSAKADEYGHPEACDWDMYGNGGKGEWRRRYLYSSVVDHIHLPDPATGLFYTKEVWTDISPPRFAVERLIPPDEALRGWRASGWDSQGHKWTDKRPTYGRYEALMFPPVLLPLVPHVATGVIADHNGYCCKEAEREKILCYGQYAEPGRVHLDEFQKLNYLLQQAREVRPGEITRDQWDAAKERGQKQYDNAFTKADASIDVLVKDSWKTHRAMLDVDPTKQKWGQFHFLTSHNKSGTPTKKQTKVSEK